MKATDFLEQQHREVEELFEKIEKTRGREQRSLFNEVAEKLLNHSRIEERIFYPAGLEVDKEATLEAYVEHDAVKGLIRKIQKTSTTDDSFMAKVTVLKEMVEHHVEEEEGEYFPLCEDNMDEERLNELGEMLETAWERLVSKGTGKRSRHKAAA